MKTFFLFHNDPLQYLKADWAAARYPFDGFIVITKERAWWGEYLWKRARRLGFAKVLDEVLLRIYWILFKNVSDHRDMRKLMVKMRNELPSDYKRPPVYRVHSVNSSESIDLLRRVKPDVCVLMVSQILSKNVFSLSRLGMLVFHPGLTPEYGGPHSAFWATLNRELWGIGWSLLRIDEGIDTGQVIAQGSAKSVDPLRESHVIMQHKSHVEGLAGVVVALRALEAGESPKVSMDGRRTGYYTHPGLTDYLKLRRVLKTLREKRDRGVSPADVN
jgi:folate-dependent phosphoribosylglycinamide formyltransferase PurN